MINTQDDQLARRKLLCFSFIFGSWFQRFQCMVTFSCCLVAWGKVETSWLVKLFTWMLHGNNRKQRERQEGVEVSISPSKTHP
jgi:hypothetical protein